MRMFSAVMDNHPRLYHYQPFTDARNVDYAARLETTLRDGTIYMSRPSGFNDPWDCRPRFNSAILDDPDERERHLRWLLNTGNARPEHEDELRANPVLLRAAIEATRDGTIAEIDARYRLYCLSPDPLNPLMWSHYGGSHRGVALEFDTRVNQMIGCYRVHYSDTYPIVRMYDGEEENANLVPMFTKSDVWSYEEEYRLLAVETDVVNPHLPNTVHSLLRLQPHALSGLMIGAQCETDHVLDLVGRYAPHLRVRRAVLQPDQYKLGFETLEPGRLRP